MLAFGTMLCHDLAERRQSLSGGNWRVTIIGLGPQIQSDYEHLGRFSSNILKRSLSSLKVYGVYAKATD